MTNLFVWDLVKYRIRSFAIKYSKEKAEERRARLAEAEKKVKRCELIYNNDPSQNNVKDLEAAKHEYDLLHDYMVCGCIVRSRINWYENGLVSIYYKTVRARKSTQGKNKIQKNKVNSLLNTVNTELTPRQTEKIETAKQTLKIYGAGFVSHFKRPAFV